MIYASALIVGAGSGLSSSLARAFMKAGMKVALAARSTAKLNEFVEATGAKAFNCDAVKRDEVENLFADLDAAQMTPALWSTMQASARAGRLSSSTPPKSPRRSRSQRMAVS